MGFPIELLAGGLGSVVPAAVNVIKSIFGKKSGNPQAVLGDLVLQKPEVVPQYLEGLAKLREAEVRVFNRDVVGQLSQWVVDLRAGIRPIVVGVSILCLAADSLAFVTFGPEVRSTFAFNIGNWLGSRNQIGR